MEPHTHYDPTKLATYTAHHDSVRIIFVLAAAYNLDLRHFDFDSAFLHEKFEHQTPVFVKQPSRFDGSLKHPHKYGKLERNLYGTKQAGYI